MAFQVAQDIFSDQFEIRKAVFSDGCRTEQFLMTKPAPMVESQNGFGVEAEFGDRRPDEVAEHVGVHEHHDLSLRA